MEILSNITLTDGDYAGIVKLWKIRPAETAQLSYFGEMQIDVGGAFTGEDDYSAVSFTLPSRIIHVPSGLPVKQSFNLADTADAAAYAHVWRYTIAKRISDALDTLMQQTDGTSGDQIYLLPFQDPS